MSEEEQQEFVAYTPTVRGRNMYPEYEVSRTTKRSEQITKEQFKEYMVKNPELHDKLSAIQREFAKSITIKAPSPSPKSRGLTYRKLKTMDPSPDVQTPLGSHIKSQAPMFFKNSKGEEKVKLAKCKLQQ